MSRLLFKIIDTLWLERIGLGVAVDAKPAHVCLRARELLELRRPDGSQLETEVARIPRVRHLCYDPEKFIAIIQDPEWAKNIFKTVERSRNIIMHSG